MTANLTAKLESLRNRATRYEVVLEKAGERRLIGYTARRSRRGLLDMAWRFGDDVARLSGQDRLFPGSCALELKVGDWLVRFSGRTLREAYIGGELPHVTEGAPAAAE